MPLRASDIAYDREREKRREKEREEPAGPRGWGEVGSGRPDPTDLCAGIATPSLPITSHTTQD